MRLLLISIIIFASSVLNAQTLKLETKTINKNSIEFSINKLTTENVVLKYGITPQLELGEVKGLVLYNLKDATFYYVKAIANKLESNVKLFSTASKSSGDITVYFNHWVNNNASSITDAIQISAFEDTIIAYINRSQNNLDICNYNTGSLPIVNAINSAETRGVNVRYISAYNTGTNNGELSNLSATIPMIQRPDDGEVMHNKFIIIDSDNPAISKIITGSVNHTANSCNNDYNNLVIVEDQSLALAYKTEFEEMWGSNTNTPNISNAKFGDAKTDNTPHSFNIGGTNVELYFSPSDATTSHIETTILSANTDMQFSMFTFINNDLGDAVESIYNSGVDVTGFIDNDWYFGSEFNSLQNAGVEVYAYSGSGLLHHKYGIVDANNTSSDPLVITGSHNWTNSAENDYDENTLIIHSAIISNMYYEEFMARYYDITGNTSIKIQDKSFTSIYPNPAINFIEINSSSKINSIRIHNSLGKQVKGNVVIDANSAKISISDLAKGIYYIKIEKDKSNTIKKMIIL